MKKRFHLLLFVLFALTGTTAVAQSTRFGVTAGVQWSHPKNYKTLTGFHVGAKGQYEFTSYANTAYLDYGLLLTTKGWKDELFVDATLKESTDWTCRLYYLELPVHFGYKLSLSDRARLFMDLGPYFAVGLYGKSKVDSKVETADAGNLFKDIYKRFDCGVGARMGVEAGRHFQLSIGYELGLMKPMKGWSPLSSSKDRTFSCAVAYYF